VVKQKKKGDDDDKRPIVIIRRGKRHHSGGHGQSWKVAYADFVTSMMAFFLLLWLLSITTLEQKTHIADYFTPAEERISRDTNGSYGLLGGTTITAPDGSKMDTAPDQNPADDEEDKKNQGADAAFDRQDEKAFIAAAESIRQAIDAAPELKELSKNLLIDTTPEGLRIQIVDQEGRSMFPLGKAEPLPQTVKLLEIITNVIKGLPNKTSIRGHTDSKQYGADASYTNWELSSDRANASRRVMLNGGYPLAQIENVQGKADREPLLPAEPDSARNRRISILLLKQSVVAGAKRSEDKFKNHTTGPAPEPKKHEEGVIYFP
jgi:chemotaxis protein MotB